MLDQNLGIQNLGGVGLLFFKRNPTKIEFRIGGRGQNFLWADPFKQTILMFFFFVGGGGCDAKSESGDPGGLGYSGLGD